MVEGIGHHQPNIGGYGSTGGVDGQQNVGRAQGGQETGRTGLNSQLQTDKVSKNQSTQNSSNNPQLDPPVTGSSNNTREITDGIINKLGKLSTDDAGKGLFVLYKLLMLLQAAMNEMQKSMQVMRQAETNVVIANIQAEANEMEDAAKFGLWMGVISGIIQVGASAFSMAGGIKGVTSASKGIQTGNQMKAAQQDITTMKTELGTMKTELGTMKTELGTLKTDMGTLKTELRGLEAAQPPNEQAIAAKQGEITQKQTDIDAKQGEIDTKQADIDKKEEAILKRQMDMGGYKAKLEIVSADARARTDRIQSIGQFIGSFAQFFKSIGDGIAGIKQADSKRIEGQIKQMEEDANKTNDLTKSVKDLLSAILQLMQTVNRNEVDTTAQIFRGI